MTTLLISFLEPVLIEQNIIIYVSTIVFMYECMIEFMTK